jgi:DNA replication regulator SLD2
MSSKSITAETSHSSRSDRISKLRVELKEWEHAFAKAHNGRKPTREETKKDKEIGTTIKYQLITTRPVLNICIPIATKYKEYYRLTSTSTSASTSSKSAKPPARPASHKSKLPAQPPDLTSPKKKVPPAFPGLTQTPTKNTTDSPWTADVYESPLSARSQRIFGNRDQVGPTPQKNGRVLGIFDSFIDVQSTPPKSGQKPSLAAESPLKKQSPSSQIPVSPSSKKEDQQLLTPRKRKLTDIHIESPSHSRTKVDIFTTPSALRHWLPQAAIADPESSPRIRRPPPRPKRGLSSMLAELREMENHALDDDEEAMREMEMEVEWKARSPTNGSAPSLPHIQKKKMSGVFDEAGLPPPPAGAFAEDTILDENNGDSDEIKAGQRRVWKKKGLKRQHRRVISKFNLTPHTFPQLLINPLSVRPVAIKSTTPPPADCSNDGDVQYVPSDIEANSNTSVSEYTDKENPNPKCIKKSSTQHEDTSTKSKVGVISKGGVVKKAVRKIQANAQSRMNFRKLNIKNKNSKGKGRGSFGRRR